MKTLLAGAGALAAALFLGQASPASAQGKTITLCWAAWDPANALVELSKDFTAKSRHQHEVRVRAVAELRRPHAQRAELQGQAVRPDHRRQPVDRRLGRERPLREAQRLLRQGRHQDDRLRAGHGRPAIPNGRRARRTTGRCRRWATRSAGPTARTGSPSPNCRPSSRRSTTATSPRPRPGPSSSRSPSSSRAARSTARRSTAPAIFTERGSEGITMGVTQRALPDRLQVPGPEEALRDGRLRQLAGRRQGPGVLQVALQVLHAAGLTNAYMGEGLDAFKSGQVAMQMNWFAFFPGLYKDPNVGGDKIGFFVNPSDKVKGSQLGGQGISVVAYSPNRNEALAIHQVVRRSPTCRRSGGRWAATPATRRVLNDPGFTKSAPFAADFLDAMGQVKDFWAEPSLRPAAAGRAEARPRLCRRRQGHRQGSARRLVEDWTEGLQGRRQDLSRPAPERRPRAAPAAGRLHATRRSRIAATAMNDATASTATAPTASPRRRATPAPIARAHARPVRPGDRLAVHRADDACCCWRSTSSR